MLGIISAPEQHLDAAEKHDGYPLIVMFVAFLISAGWRSSDLLIGRPWEKYWRHGSEAPGGHYFCVSTLKVIWVFRWCSVSCF